MKPVTVAHFFALSGCDYTYVLSLLKQKFLKAQKKPGLRRPNCAFRMKTGQGGGQVAEEHHQKEGPPGGGTASTLRTHAVCWGAGNLSLGRKTILSYLTILQAFVKQLLLPFAVQMSLPGSVVVESIFFRERWKRGLRSWTRLPDWFSWLP